MSFRRPQDIIREAEARQRQEERDARERTERELLDAAYALGGIAECPHWVTAGLATRVVRSGRGLEELSVGELLEIVREQQATLQEVLDGDDRD